MSDDNPDKKPEDKKKKRDLNAVPIDPSHTFLFYLKPGNFTKIISNLKLIYASWALLGYIQHFLMIIVTINVYSDNDRLLPCFDG